MKKFYHKFLLVAFFPILVIAIVMSTLLTLLIKLLPYPYKFLFDCEDK